MKSDEIVQSELMSLNSNDYRVSFCPCCRRLIHLTQSLRKLPNREKQNNVHGWHVWLHALFQDFFPMFFEIFDDIARKSYTALSSEIYTIDGAKSLKIKFLYPGSLSPCTNFFDFFVIFYDIAWKRESFNLRKSLKTSKASLCPSILVCSFFECGHITAVLT